MNIQKREGRGTWLFSYTLNSLMLSLLIFGLSTTGYAADRIAPALALLQEQTKDELKLYGDADAIVVYRSVLAQHVRDFAKNSYTEYNAVYIRSDRGATDYAQIQVPFNSFHGHIKLDFANVLTADGRTIPVHPEAIQVQDKLQSLFYQNERQLVFSIPQVRPGNTIEFQTTYYETRPQIPEHWSKITFYHWWQPTHDQSYRVDPVLHARFEIEDSINDRIHASNFLDEIGERTQRTVSDNDQVTTWTLKHLDGLQFQQSAPMRELSKYALYWTSLTDWRVIDEWTHSLVAPKLSATADLEAIAKSLLRPGMSVNEKLKAAFDWVDHNIYYVYAHANKNGFEPRTITQTLVSGFGDCKDQTTLTLALLRLMGVSAYPALARTQGGFQDDTDLPRMNFDHMLVYVPNQDITSHINWLDVSGKKQLFPGPIWTLGYHQAFIVDGKGGRLINSVSNLAEIIDLTVHIELQAQTPTSNTTKTLAGIARITFGGALEGRQRQFLQTKSLAQRRSIAAALARQILPQYKLISVQIENLYQLFEPLQFSYTIELAALAIQNNSIVVQADIAQFLFASGALTGLVNPLERFLPYQQQAYKVSYSLIVPSKAQHMHLEAFSKGANYKTEFFTVEQSLTTHLEHTILTMTAELPARKVELDDYSTYYRYFQQLEQLPSWILNYVHPIEG